MKILIVSLLFVLVSVFGFSQAQISDTSNVIQEYETFFMEYEKEMQTWTQDRIDYFNKTFVYTRGNFTIPDEKIVPYVPKN